MPLPLLPLMDFQKSVECCQYIVHLFQPQVLVHADVYAVVPDILGIRKLAFPITEETETCALSRHGGKQRACFNADSIPCNLQVRLV